MSDYHIEDTIGPDGETEYSYRGWRLERLTCQEYCRRYPWVVSGHHQCSAWCSDVWHGRPPYELDVASAKRLWPGHWQWDDGTVAFARPCNSVWPSPLFTIEAVIDLFEASLAQHRAAAWRETAQRLGWV